MKTIGNYLTQSGGVFPLDCNTLADLEANISLCAVLGNLFGDKVIIKGCEENESGYRNPGYVFLCTEDYPAGEILEWEGGNAPIFHLNKENVRVTSGENTYPSAYTKRSLVPGGGDEWFKWSDMKRLHTLYELEQSNNDLKRKLEERGLAPLGTVELFAGKNIPDNYALCDGSMLKKVDYPELYEVLGDTYNTAADQQGNAFSTEQGYFRLPDLRGRFIVGQSSSDNTYKTKGNTGGEKKHKLTASELPEHSHEFTDYMFIARAGEITSANVTVGTKAMTCGSVKTGGFVRRNQVSDADADNNYMQYIKNSTEISETDVAVEHENRPPYYTLAYIMRLK